MLCSLVDIVPAGSTADRAVAWSKEAVDAFASMIGNKAILLTVCCPYSLLELYLLINQTHESIQ